MTYDEALSSTYELFERIDQLPTIQDPKTELEELDLVRQQIHEVGQHAHADSELNWALTGLDDAFMKACMRHHLEVPMLST